MELLSFLGTKCNLSLSKPKYIRLISSCVKLREYAVKLLICPSKLWAPKTILLFTAVVLVNERFCAISSLFIYNRISFNVEL